MPLFFLRKVIHNGSRLLATLAATSVLAACGYKGPLYMPPPPAPDESLTTPPQSMPETPAASSTNTDQ